MGDRYPKVRGAVVQAAPVFLDREATVEKACALIADAAHGAPWRLLIPGGACFTSVKWVDRLEITAAPGEREGERIARSGCDRVSSGSRSVSIVVPRPPTDADHAEVASGLKRGRWR